MSIFRLSVVEDAGEEKVGSALCADAEGGASVSGKALCFRKTGEKGVTNKTKYEFGFEGNRAAWSC